MENALHKSNVNKLALAGIGIAAGLIGGVHAVSANTIHVNAGDTLTSLSVKTGVSVDDLKAANNLQNDLIYANTDLQTDKAQNQNNVVNDVYTVQAGDTLSTIAENNGSDVDQIKNANGLTSDLIYVGQQLKLHVDASAQTNNQPVAQHPQQAPQTTVSQSTAPATNTTVTQSTSNYQPAQQNSYTGTTSNGGGSVHDQFIAAGGTEELWNSVVMPESGGNPDAVSPNGFRGIGQTKEWWGTGSVAQQTQGLLNYANSRYGSPSAAAAFRQAHGWW